MAVKRKMTITFILTIILVMVFIVSCRKVISTPDPEVVMSQFTSALEKYNQIQLGMSSAAVEGVMGKQGIDPYNTHTPSPGEPPLPKGFLNEFIDNGFEITTAYNQGFVVTKSFDWPFFISYPSKQANATEEDYNQVKIGMSYDEVAAIMGTPGLTWAIRDSVKPGMNITGSGLNLEVNTFTEDYKTVTYAWFVDTGKSSYADIMFINFAQDEVSSKTYKGKSIFD
jgi:outer membrane protein assembly factor BamE (lipoprotein component of BamABCDE complex)